MLQCTLHCLAFLLIWVEHNGALTHCSIIRTFDVAKLGLHKKLACLLYITHQFGTEICEGSVTPRFDVQDSESTWIRGGFLDSSRFVVDSGRFLIIFMQRIMRFIEILTYSTWIPGF